MTSQRQHQGSFPHFLIVIQIETMAGRREWRTFTQPHHAANWMAKHVLTTQGVVGWFQVELFTSQAISVNVAPAVEAAILESSSTVHATRTGYVRAVATAIKGELAAAIHNINPEGPR